MGWKEVAAGLGTKTTISALEAAKGQVTKRKYKRLIATAVAQLLELHPDIGPQKARRRARRLTGAKPSKKLLRAARNVGLKEGVELAAAAAVSAGVAKVASTFGDRLKEKFGHGADEGTGTDDGQEAGELEPSPDIHAHTGQRQGFGAQ